jgi:hypothetical protein
VSSSSRSIFCVSSDRLSLLLDPADTRSSQASFLDKMGCGNDGSRGRAAGAKRAQYRPRTSDSVFCCCNFAMLLFLLSTVRMQSRSVLTEQNLRSRFFTQEVFGQAVSGLVLPPRDPMRDANSICEHNRIRRHCRDCTPAAAATGGAFHQDFRVRCLTLPFCCMLTFRTVRPRQLLRRRCIASALSHFGL